VVLKVPVVVGNGSVQRSSVIQQDKWLQNLQWKSECPKKKLRRFPHVFRNPLRPGAREPISVVIPVDLL
jgi:hypothetical protein